MPGSPIIVCFGDSLTAGFQSPTKENPQGRSTPYGEWLPALLGCDLDVRISGVCGELTGEMVARFRRDALEHKPRCVAILGGTNDLGWRGAPGDIMRNLLKMYEWTLSAGAVPLPITVPSLRVEGAHDSREGAAWLDDHLARRRQLNRAIQDYAASKHLPCVDLFQATAEPESQRLAERYSNDGLHLTTAGYRVLAEAVARAVRPLVLQPGVSP